MNQRHNRSTTAAKQRHFNLKCTQMMFQNTQSTILNRGLNIFAKAEILRNIVVILTPKIANTSIQYE